MGIRSILVADDERVINSYLQRKLTRLGYTVYVAEDGKTALDLAFINAPDIILLDVKLPQLDGYAVCRALKAEQNTKHIPIIMLSAKAQNSEIREGFRAGADRYICKPVGFSDILKEIQAFDRQDDAN
jgi:DNA-binding response OmpR family regulator